MLGQTHPRRQAAGGPGVASAQDGGLTDEAGLPEPIGVEQLGRIAVEDLAFFIDVVTLSVDRRRLGVGVQGCHRLRDRPREVDVV